MYNKKTKAHNTSPLLWVDLETTGTDFEEDSIIEIGAILTTYDLNIISEFEIIIKPTSESYKRMMLNSVVSEMHTVNGLINDLANTDTTQDQATQEMLLWIKSAMLEYGGENYEGKFVLSGSGVGHLDRGFIKSKMPDLDSLLRYWHVDIGVVRRAHDMWVGTEVTSINDAKTHRAIDDIRCHLQEAGAFRDLWTLDTNC